MRIAHVIHSYYPRLGGIERAVQYLAEEQAKMGHEVMVITSNVDVAGSPKEEIINGVRVVRLRSRKLLYNDLTMPREMPRDMLKNADIVHGWGQNSFFTYKVCKEAKKLGKPVVTYFIGVDYLKHHFNPFIKVFGYRYQVWITKKVVEITDLALVTNEYERRILKERYGLESIVLPHGVDEVYLKAPNMAECFRENYRVEGKIVSYIARVHPTKGLDLLTRAFAEVVKQVPDAVLVVTGKGDENYLGKCLKLAEKLGIRDRVKYVGYISEEDKIAVIDASEVVVLPTRHAGESYPLLLDEVASRRRPMVATNVSRALASRAEKLGLIVTSPDVYSLASSIMKVLIDLEGRRTYKEHRVYTWKEIAQKLLEIYNKGLRI